MAFIRILTSHGDEFEFEHAELKMGLEQIEVQQDGAEVFSERREQVAYWSVNEDWPTRKLPMPATERSRRTCAE